jgi:AcrR family transcriptional regulator
MNIVHETITASVNNVQEALVSGSKEKSTADRRVEQRDRLVACAESLIAHGGLEALRARDLAKQMGCAVGAIYNLVGDLDELALLVARRTLADLSSHLDAAIPSASGADAILVAWGAAYLRYAMENRLRWAALFAFRLPPDTALPAWFAESQVQLFARLEDRLVPLMPDARPSDLALKARVLFSAVHGIVSLGLEEKLVAMPLDAIAGELEAFVRAYLHGLR